MDFTTLTDQIKDTLSRYDDTVVTNIPYFINQAQQRIAREVTIIDLVKLTKNPVVKGKSFFEKPADFIRPLSCYFHVPGLTYSKNIEYRSKEFIIAYLGAAGDPLYYTDGATTVTISPNIEKPIMIFCPTLERDEGVDIWLEYYAYPGDLSEGTRTNALTKSAPNLLLYGSLLECAPFLKEDERIQIWQQYYNDAKEMYGTTNVASKQDRSRDLMKD